MSVTDFHILLIAMSHKKARAFFKNDALFSSVTVPQIPLREKKSHFDTLVVSIIYQQISGKAGASIYKKLQNHCRGKVTPEKIAVTRTSQFRKVGISPQKMGYLRDLSKKFINKEISTRALALKSDQEVIDELVKIKGIGVWTSQMFLIFHLGREDVFPSKDLGIQKALSKILSKNLNEKDMLEISEKWKPYRTYASLMLWKIIDTTNPDDA